MHRLLKLGALSVLLVVTATGCSGSSALDNTEAVVFLTVNILEFNPEVNVCLVTGTSRLRKCRSTPRPRTPTTRSRPTRT